MGKEISIENIEEAFHLIHGELSMLPSKYCYWKKETDNGKTTSKTLDEDYRPLFSFVKVPALRNNLAELRMCFDYHRSLYELHEPGLLFGWQHKLVLCQMIAAIYEGLLLDFLKYSSEKNDSFSKTVVKERINSGVGFGYLIEMASQAELIDKKWKEYLINLKYVRDTVHPKSLNTKHTSFKENSIMKSSPEDLLENFDRFIDNIKPKY